MKAYIMKVRLGIEPDTHLEFPDDWAYAAYLGCLKRGIEVIFFEEIEEVPRSKNDIVICNIEDTIKYFNRVGIKVPDPLNIPEELREYTQRNYEVMTMGEFKKGTKLPIFVKPYGKLKGFDNVGVITREDSRRMLFTDVDDDATVLVSDVVDIVSEWRGFVHKGELVGLQHYLSDFTIFPDVNVIKNAIKDYKSAPVAYTIDFGITADGKTILIECNDAWSIGNYGLTDKIYIRLLIDRWLEIIRNS